jgi:glutamate-1-semialdehyde 2,1-aminomutase
MLVLSWLKACKAPLVTSLEQTSFSSQSRHPPTRYYYALDHLYTEALLILDSQISAVFILDEVLTSRLAAGGLQSVIGLKPDLTTLGKYLGGSLAFGALGGRRDIMAVFDPRSPGALPHSGTFNNNTVTMRAGYAGLKHVYTPQVAEELNNRGYVFLEKLQAVSKGTQLCFTGRGSLICSHFIANGSSQVKSIAELEENETLKELYWLEMIEKGFWVARRGSLAISLCVPQVELDRFVEETEDFLARYREEAALYL